MATKQEVESLMRFLSKEAKLPLQVAIVKIPKLQQASLTSPELLVKSKPEALAAVFPDPKDAKAVLAAAKRVSKKRPADATSPHPTSPPSKRGKASNPPGASSAADLEASLALPASDAPPAALAATTLHTNRAPLVLAFAVTLLAHILPAQPLSARLSLAQAVVSANARTKAHSVGLAPGRGAAEEGWGRGQPRVRILGRDIAVLKRDVGGEGAEGRDEEAGGWKPPEEVPLWGVDLEALRAANTSTAAGRAGAGGLPIHTPQAARAYLLKSFASAPGPAAEAGGAKAKKPTAAQRTAELERNAGLLLRALELLFASWAGVLNKAELDKRAWDWYVAVRPAVEPGAKGWGGKGEVKLAQILKLRKGEAGGVKDG